MEQIGNTPNSKTNKKIKQKKYNLREKNKVKEFSSSDDEYIPPSDSDFDSEEEYEQEYVVDFNRNDFQKLLGNMFPSGYMNEKISAMEKLNSINRKKQNIDVDDEFDNTDNDIDDIDDFENPLSNKFNFNIHFSINKNDDYDSEYDDDYSYNSEEENEQYQNEECDEDEEYNEPEQNPKFDSDKNTEPPRKKSRIQPISVENYDEKTSEELKNIISDFANNKEDRSKDRVIQKMQDLIDEEDKMLVKKRENEERKYKITNTKLFKKYMKEKTNQNEIKYFKNASIEEQNNLLEKMKHINKFVTIDKPYKVSLIESNIPVHYKAKAIKKINALKYMDPGSGEYYKTKDWVDTFMKIPFGKYCKLPMHIDDGVDKCTEFMENAKDSLNNVVYGLDDAKLQILQMVGQWISNPDAIGSAIAIKGPMGTGKTTLVKEGISKILNRPFAFIALGGATDSSFLEGHSYTYEGSVWGKIVDIIIQSKCMNPVIYFDELDKVSDSAKGEEIIGILTHLTDTTQNSQFHDKYFSGIDFDLSKCLFIFSYNEESKVNPILRDRMYKIETEGYNCKQKKTISNNYLIPKIIKNVNFRENDINLTDKALEYIIENYTEDEKGVRNLKRCIEIIYTKLNMFRLMKPETELFDGIKTFEISYPFVVDENIVSKLIKRKNEVKKYNSMYI
tara:strand:- start:3189 stop:5213 length:2025 start_codon:yes stop_codon:yes gene_type:complete